jgi:hypothetical protein
MAAGVQIVGLDQAQRKLAALAAALPQVGGTAVRAAGARMGEAMEERAPDLSDDFEGSIARSIHTERVSPTEVLVGTRHGLGPIFEYGGEITPDEAERLRFEGRGGDVVYAPRVIIPAQPFIRPAVDEQKGEAGQAAERAAMRSLRRYT